MRGVDIPTGPFYLYSHGIVPGIVNDRHAPQQQTAHSSHP